MVSLGGFHLDVSSLRVMPSVVFVPALQRHVACPLQEVSGRTVREVLGSAFGANPRARS